MVEDTMEPRDSETLRLVQKLKTVPNEPGAYLLKDREGEVLYVGKARELRKRLQQHLRSDSPLPWARRMYDQVADFDYIITRSETEAFLLEANLIKKKKPPFNVRLADDKSYPYLMLTDEQFPRVTVVRDLPYEAQVQVPGSRGRNKRGVHDPKSHAVYGLQGNRLFGPYPDASAVWGLRKIVSQLFGLRECRKHLEDERPGRGCLNYHIRRCSGPCRGDVSSGEYMDRVRQAILFLEGRTGDVIDELRGRMDRAAAQQNYEAAATFRDRIRAVERASEKQLITLNEERDEDVLGVATEDGWAAVEVFPVRQGRLHDPCHYIFSHVEGRTIAEIIEACLTLHYSTAVIPPKVILLPLDVEDRDGWERVLADIRGTKVTLAVPRRGERRRLVEMADRNARLALARTVQERGERARSNRAAVDDLQQALQLGNEPRRIECYDISNLQGHQAVGSMVVFQDGVPDRKSYRRFRIRSLEGTPNDFAMMAETVRRRLQRGLAGDEKFLPMPDLILVDGGKGQVSAVQEVLVSDIHNPPDLAGLAKKQEEVFVPGNTEPLDMEEHPRGHFLLQRIRDEAHRFALTYHQNLRNKTVSRSELENIPGIGPARRTALFQAFPSITAMQQASVDELAAVPGMTRGVAESLRRYFDGIEEDIVEGE